MKKLIVLGLFSFMIFTGANAFAYHGPVTTQSYNPYNGVTTIVIRYHDGSKLIMKRNRFGVLISRVRIAAPPVFIRRPVVIHRHRVIVRPRPVRRVLVRSHQRRVAHRTPVRRVVRRAVRNHRH